MKIFGSTDILMPASADMHRWAVIACDQFTSDTAYWQRVADTVGESASTLHMILPEAHLGSADEAAIVKKINATMDRYLTGDVFTTYANSYIYVERTLINGSIRPGLIGAVDLEQYDYNPGSVSAIRATEKTVLERIPPRQRVRKDAGIEFPHVLMLCDDDQKQLIEPIAAVKDQLTKLYDFDLMMNGGHLAGWAVDTPELLAEVDRSLNALLDTKGEHPLLLAVGGLVGRGLIQTQILGVGSVTTTQLLEMMNASSDTMTLVTVSLVLQFAETMAVPLFALLLAEGAAHVLA